jgi:hypothetical protein
MRNALLIFLLLNILAFVYQKWILEPDVLVAPDFMDQDHPGLIQAEKPEDRVVAVTLPADDGAGGSKATTCIRIGPFSEEQDALKVRQSLEQRASRIEQTAAEGQVWAGFWVQLTPRPEYAQAEKARDALVAAGMKDAYILSDEEGHSVSIGLFRLRASANRAAEQVKALGYEIIVKDRYQPGMNYWLTVAMQGDRPLQAGEFQGSADRILRTETVSCPGAES